MIVISPARPLAQIETGRPGHRTTIAGARVGSATVLLCRYDKDSAVACLNALRVTAFVHPRLPTE